VRIRSSGHCESGGVQLELRTDCAHVGVGVNVGVRVGQVATCCMLDAHTRARACTRNH